MTVQEDERKAGERERIALVRSALDESRVALAFQPIVDGRDPSKVAFYECLIRIHDAAGRLIPAAHFIDAVENDEAGRRLDLAALRLAIEAARLQSTLRLSVNMSVLTIGDPRWMACLEAAVADDPSVAERLIVEFTERAPMDGPSVPLFMARCRELGLSFALDDFGAGYSSFRNLHELRFDIIKIDGSYIRDLERQTSDRLFAQAIMALAGHFDTLAVAECVETEGQARILQDLGVDCMQGWLFGKPAMTPQAPLPLPRADAGTRKRTA